MKDTSTSLTFVRRKNIDGAPSVAPFIGEFNVWDIAPGHWTDDVKSAIKHAYELGWRACNDRHKEVEDFYFNFGSDYFKEV